MDLPLELIDLVLSRLSTSDDPQQRKALGTCMLVSKAWYWFARRHQFRDITIGARPSQYEDTLHVLTHSHETLDVPPLICVIEVLRIHFPYLPPTSPPHIDALCDLLQRFNQLPETSSLHTLEIKGPDQDFSLIDLPSPVMSLLHDLIQNARISTLAMKWISSLPIHLLSQHLRHLFLTSVGFVAYGPSFLKLVEAAEASRVLDTLSILDCHLDLEGLPGEDESNGEDVAEEILRMPPSTMLMRYLCDARQLKSLAFAVSSSSKLETVRSCLSEAPQLERLAISHARTAHRYAELYPLDAAPSSLTQLSLSAWPDRPLFFKKKMRHSPAILAYIQAHGYAFRSGDYPGNPACQPQKIETLIDFTRLRVPPTVTDITVHRVVLVRIAYGALPPSAPLALHIPAAGLGGPASPFLRDCDYWESLAYQMHRLSIVTRARVRLHLRVTLKYLGRKSRDSGMRLPADVQWERRNEILRDIRAALDSERRATPGAEQSKVELDLEVKHQFPDGHNGR